MAITIVAVPGSATANSKRVFACSHCGSEFTGWASQRKGKRVYCGHACKNSAMVGRTFPVGSRTRRVARVCVQCGTLMVGIRSQMRRRRLCSVSCQRAYLSGPNCPAWRGGTSSERLKLQNSPEYQVWRLAVLVRDGGRCRQCDAAGVRMYRELEVHHIIPVAASWDTALLVDNGITLCRPHHVATQGRENESAEYFAALVGAPLVSLPSANRKDRTPLTMTEEELREEYITRERSTASIGAEHGVTPECVQKYMRRFGIRARGAKEAAQLRFARAV